MNLRLLFLVFILNLNNFTLAQQKINLDSLLQSSRKEFNENRNYEIAKKLNKLGLQIDPNYLDFKVEMGKYYNQKKLLDSAYYYYGQVIASNTNYKEVFKLINTVLIEKKDFENSLKYSEQSIFFYPDEKEFYNNKLQALENIFNTISTDQNNIKIIQFLELLNNKYLNDKEFKLKLFKQKSLLQNQRIGINYNQINFNENTIGKNFIASLFYINENYRYTFIGKTFYQERLFSNQSVSKGMQYETDLYLKNSLKSYSFFTASYSNDTILFPKIKLGYSYNYNFKKAWEGDIGIRFINNNKENLYTSVLGFGKYFGSYWINAKNYMLFSNSKIYPSFTINSRYYFNTKNDYYGLQASYGTTPDERNLINSNFQNNNLKSYRIGIGYNHIIKNKYILGLQINDNHQEYIQNLYKNVLDFFISFQIRIK